MIFQMWKKQNCWSHHILRFKGNLQLIFYSFIKVSLFLIKDSINILCNTIHGIFFHYETFIDVSLGDMFILHFCILYLHHFYLNMIIRNISACKDRTHMCIYNYNSKTLMLAKIKGRRRRGKQRMIWLDGITDSVDMNLSKLR